MSDDDLVGMLHIEDDEDGIGITVSISGKFDFNLHSAFQSVLKAVDTVPPKQVTIDLERVESVDSSALGMLLSLTEKAIRIEINRANSSVERSLEEAGFNRIFPFARKQQL